MLLRIALLSIVVTFAFSNPITREEVSPTPASTIEETTQELEEIRISNDIGAEITTNSDLVGAEVADKPTSDSEPEVTEESSSDKEAEVSDDRSKSSEKKDSVAEQPKESVVTDEANKSSEKVSEVADEPSQSSDTVSDKEAEVSDDKSNSSEKKDAVAEQPEESVVTDEANKSPEQVSEVTDEPSQSLDTVSEVPLEQIKSSDDDIAVKEEEKILSGSGSFKSEAVEIETEEDSSEKDASYTTDASAKTEEVVQEVANTILSDDISESVDRINENIEDPEEPKITQIKAEETESVSPTTTEESIIANVEKKVADEIDSTDDVTEQTIAVEQELEEILADDTSDDDVSNLTGSPVVAEEDTQDDKESSELVGEIDIATTAQPDVSEETKTPVESIFREEVVLEKDEENVLQERVDSDQDTYFENPTTQIVESIDVATEASTSSEISETRDEEQQPVAVETIVQESSPNSEVEKEIEVVTEEKSSTDLPIISSIEKEVELRAEVVDDVKEVQKVDAPLTEPAEIKIAEIQHDEDDEEQDVSTIQIVEITDAPELKLDETEEEDSEIVKEVVKSVPEQINDKEYWKKMQEQEQKATQVEQEVPQVAEELVQVAEEVPQVVEEVVQVAEVPTEIEEVVQVAEEVPAEAEEVLLVAEEIPQAAVEIAQEVDDDEQSSALSAVVAQKVDEEAEEEKDVIVSEITKKDPLYTKKQSENSFQESNDIMRSFYFRDPVAYYAINRY